MKEIILTEKRYNKVVNFLSEACENLSQEKLSDVKKYNMAMNCLEYLSSVENTQYDEQLRAVSVLLTDNQMEETIKCLIDFIPFRRRRVKK